MSLMPDTTTPDAPPKRRHRSPHGPGNAVPPWVDMAMLCWCICASASTVDKWVLEGVLPPPRKRGGKLMWKWSEVDEMLTVGGDRSPDAEAEEIKNATRRAQAESRAGH